VINGALSASLFGCFFGILNGFLCRYFLKKSLGRSDKVFFGFFIGGIFYRLLFLVSSVLFLRHKKDIISLAAYSISLIFFQFIFEVKPVKHGTERNTGTPHN